MNSHYPADGDGFLATNSLIATLVLLYRATAPTDSTHDQDLVLPTSGSAQEGSLAALSKRTIVVLAQGWAVPAAVDFETSFSEAALANVTVTDPRNFAHGRHNWLSVHAKETGIVSLETLKSHRETSHTLKYIPNCIDILRIESALEGPPASIELVHSVMELAGQAAIGRGIDPGQPSVPDFGRRMYRAGSTQRAGRVEPAPITKKRMALFLPSEPSLYNLESALKNFLQRIGQTSFKGLVVDYDGTLCATQHRFDPLDEEVQVELHRLLGAGIRLGVASGRGGSIYDQLKHSIEERYWHQVIVGLYNGAIVVKLSETLPQSEGDSPIALKAAYSRLKTPTAVTGFRNHRTAASNIATRSHKFGPIPIANSDHRTSCRAERARSSCFLPFSGRPSRRHVQNCRSRRSCLREPRLRAPYRRSRGLRRQRLRSFEYRTFPKRRPGLEQFGDVLESWRKRSVWTAADITILAGTTCGMRPIPCRHLSLLPRDRGIGP